MAQSCPTTHMESQASKAVEEECDEGLDDQASAHDTPFDMKFVEDGSQQLVV